MDKLLLNSYETVEINETTEEKLERIRRELDELHDELKKGKTKTVEGDLKQVEVLRGVFKNINKEIKEKSLLDINIVQEHIEPIDTAKPNQSLNDSMVSSSDLLTVNEKIQTLEATLGYTHPLTPSETVSTKLNAMYSKLQLLANDKEQLESISKQIDDLNEKFQSSLALRRQGLFQTSSSQLNDPSVLDKMEDKELLQLYKIYENLSPFIDLLPYLLKRLESVHQIHLHSAGAVRFVNDLDEHLTTMENDMKEWESSLKEMEGKIKGLEEVLKDKGSAN